LRGKDYARILLPMKRWGVVLVLILAFCGLSDSAYITQHELTGTPLICNIQNLSGCNVVASSQYSRVFGIPIAELGIVFYGVLFVIAALEIVLFDRLLRRLLQGMAVMGILFSLYFTAIQVFVIDAFCIYCLISAFITLCVFILASCIEPLRIRAREGSTPV
jgi:uncharacterized membrane protein